MQLKKSLLRQPRAARYASRLAVFVLVLSASTFAHAARTNAAGQAGESADEGTVSITFGAGYTTSSLQGGVSPRASWHPVLDLSYARGRFFAGFGGIGYTVLQTEQVTVSTALSYSPGRRERESPVLRGMGDISGSAAGTLSAQWAPFGDLLSLSASGTFASKRAIGNTYDIGANVGFPVTEKLNGFVGVGAQFGDKNHMQTFYGVNAQQRARTGRALYTPGAGLISTSASLGMSYDINKNWSVTSTIDVSRLGDKAAKSPNSERRQQPSFSVSATYTF